MSDNIQVRLQNLGVRAASMLMVNDKVDNQIMGQALEMLFGGLSGYITQLSLYIMDQDGQYLREETFVENGIYSQGNDILMPEQIARRLSDDGTPRYMHSENLFQVSIPLRVQGITLGMLAATSLSTIAENVIDGLRLLGDALALGVKYVKLSRKKERADQLVKMANYMSREMQSLVGSPKLLSRFVCLAVKQLGFDRATLFLFDTDRMGVQHCICSINGDNVFKLKKKPHISFESDHPVYISEIEGFMLPLKVGTRYIGAMLVDNILSLEPAPRDSIDILADLCGEVALLCENALLFGRLREASIRDDLTNLYRRSYFYERVKEYIKGRDPIAMVILDIDHFKMVNDTYGHVAGDDILVQAASLISASTRSSDLACRMGGDEFVILLRGESCSHYETVGSRLLESFFSHCFTLPDKSTIHISISMGAALYPLHASTFMELFNKADGALYISKTEGRGRITIARES